MKKFLNSKFGQIITLSSISLINLLLLLILYFVKQPIAYGVSNNLWKLDIYTSSVIFHLYYILIPVFIVSAVLSVLSILLLFLKRTKKPVYFSSIFTFIHGLAIIILNLFFKSFNTISIVLSALICSLSFAILLFLILTRNYKLKEDSKTENKSEESEEPEEKVIPYKKSHKIAMLILDCLSLILFFLPLFFPLLTVKGTQNSTITLIQGLNGQTEIYITIAFIAFALASVCAVLFFSYTISSYKTDIEFASRSKSLVLLSTLYNLLFFVLGFAVSFIMKLNQGVDTSTICFIPLIISLVMVVAISAIQGMIKMSVVQSKDDEKPRKLRWEPLVYILFLTAATFANLFIKVISINSSYNNVETQNVSYTGIELIKNNATLSGGFQMLSFLLLVFLIASALLLAITASSFFAKSKTYYMFIKIASISNVLFNCMLGMFTFYFQIAQKINQENIESLLAQNNITIQADYTYVIKSQCFILMAISVALLLIMLVRKSFDLEPALNTKVSLTNVKEIADTLDELNSKKAEEENNEELSTEENITPEEPTKEYEEETEIYNFDACPAFTELDSKLEQYEQDLAKRKEKLFVDPTLPNIVTFIVDYARESRLHLSYSKEDIATFVSGLGASRLSILQGMSGTGKTSLPKIFTEALLGNCEIVEVESSWRDKNELLGYYNEFSKCFTPKKFTQCLYKAKLNSEIPTLIVLDEMNLSRIEYYFSDFLSLMENEEDKREIKLLNVKLFRTENGEKIPYKALDEGHTIKIPTNVWFIGTANRDESTFAISDKVYDRAQTMNFNKRAPKIRAFEKPLDQKFLSYEQFSTLLNNAINNGKYEAEDDPIVSKVEKLLQPYNISFGNRILKQMEEFVNIYTACLTNKANAKEEAVEKILLSKVVSKLETKVVENKEQLAGEFDRISLPSCALFIRNLNED